MRNTGGPVEDFFLLQLFLGLVRKIAKAIFSFATSVRLHEVTRFLLDIVSLRFIFEYISKIYRPNLSF